MENNNENSGFTYIYSAKEQQELKKIRAKYAPQEENKMQRLRRLDRRVSQKAETVALSLGIIGALILGFGMSLFMSTLGDALGMSQGISMLIGIVAGVIGGVVAALAYPVYQAVLKRERERVAPEILRLTDELMK